MPQIQANQTNPQIEKHANKKTIIVCVVIGLIVIVSAILLSTEISSRYIKSKAGGIKEVDVGFITAGNSYVDYATQQQYADKDISTVFTVEGWYKNNHFYTTYSENGRILMKIGSDMKPNDGVIEGYIVEKIENRKPMAYIFLDNDFKERVKNVKIYWGKYFDKSKEFNFTDEVSNGVYMEVIEDDISRFENDFSLHSGGIIIGDLNNQSSTAIMAS